MMLSKRWRTLAVTAMKSVSQLPQSFSMASLVRSVVVSGPGVSRMGSRSMSSFQAGVDELDFPGLGAFFDDARKRPEEQSGQG